MVAGADEFREAKVLLSRDRMAGLERLKKLLDEIVEEIAPGWKGSGMTLAEYAAAKRYPNFFHEMADRIESSVRVVESGDAPDTTLVSAMAFLIEVRNRLRRTR